MFVTDGTIGISSLSYVMSSFVASYLASCFPKNSASQYTLAVTVGVKISFAPISSIFPADSSNPRLVLAM